MDSIQELRLASEARRIDSATTAEAYGYTLRRLGYSNLLLVVGAAVLSLLAGASGLGENALWSAKVSGWLALISSVLVTIHSKLGCEQYQTECRRLRAVYAGLSIGYGDLRLVQNNEEFQKRFFALNDQMQTLAESTMAVPFFWASNKARRQVTSPLVAE